MDSVYAGSIAGLAIFGAGLLCGLLYFVYECRRTGVVMSREQALLSMDSDV